MARNTSHFFSDLCHNESCLEKDMAEVCFSLYTSYVAYSEGVSCDDKDVRKDCFIALASMALTFTLIYVCYNIKSRILAAGSVGMPAKIMARLFRVSLQQYIKCSFLGILLSIVPLIIVSVAISIYPHLWDGKEIRPFVAALCFFVFVAVVYLLRKQFNIDYFSFMFYLFMWLMVKLIMVLVDMFALSADNTGRQEKYNVLLLKPT